MIRYGFMDDPDIPRALEGYELDGKGFNMMDTTVLLSRETLVAPREKGRRLE